MKHDYPQNDQPQTQRKQIQHVVTRFSAKFSTQLGFTLMELMVVMMIIGILGTIVGGSFIQTKMKARDSSRKNDIGQLQRSLEAYYNDHGTYPLSVDGSGLVIGIAWGGSFTDSTSVYMVKLPNDAKQPNIQFFYRTNTKATKYQIYTHLENAQDLEIVSFSPVLQCGTGGYACNYGRSSSNTLPTTDLSLE